MQKLPLQVSPRHHFCEALSSIHDAYSSTVASHSNIDHKLLRGATSPTSAMVTHGTQPFSTITIPPKTAPPGPLKGSHDAIALLQLDLAWVPARSEDTMGLQPQPGPVKSLWSNSLTVSDNCWRFFLSVLTKKNNIT